MAQSKYRAHYDLIRKTVGLHNPASLCVRSHVETAEGIPCFPNKVIAIGSGPELQMRNL